MLNVLALYRGEKAHSLDMLTLTAEPAIVRVCAAQLLRARKNGMRGEDPILGEVDEALVRALEAIADGKDS